MATSREDSSPREAEGAHGDTADVPRSRRGQFEYRQSHTDDEDTSFEEIGHRSPSLDRASDLALDRQPGVDHGAAGHSERRPSLDRLDFVFDQKSERRPSLERLNHSSNQASERRPSLERLQGSGARAGHQGFMGLREQAVRGSSGQGINMLQPCPLTRQGVPSNWRWTATQGGSGHLYELVPLNAADIEYSAILVDFEEAGVKVESICRLQNKMLLDRYEREKEGLISHRPREYDLNERYLYHGTRANQHHLCEEGLDHRLSYQGCFGRGTYFSDNPRKCIGYTRHNDKQEADSQPMILVCRVLLGDSKVYPRGQSDPNLKREPEKPNMPCGWRYYDSVQGLPVDFAEFVVYDNRRSMIEYIVTFESPPDDRPMSTTRSLYRSIPVKLPLPEDELDRLYMMGPDTDSDGSCDETTREVERLRNNVKKEKAKNLGIPYRPPTEEEKRCERLHWKLVCYHHCPPDSPMFTVLIQRKKEEKEERRKLRMQHGKQKVKKGPGHHGDMDIESDEVSEVLSRQIADFLNITNTQDVEAARQCIVENSMELDRALHQFYNELE